MFMVISIGSLLVIGGACLAIGFAFGFLLGAIGMSKVNKND